MSAQIWNIDYNGITWPEARTSNQSQNEYMSWIEIDIGLTTNTLNFTVAHEFSHAVQFSYSYHSAERWIHENTSQWMGHIMYPNHIFYIGAAHLPLLLPQLKISYGFQNDDYWYGGGLWIQFLTEWKDGLIAKRLWQRMGDVNLSLGVKTFQDIQAILENSYNSSFNEALKQYAIWRYFTGRYANTSFFSNANRLILVDNAPYTYSISTYPLLETTIVPNDRTLSGPGGTSFIEFRNGAGTITIGFDGTDGYQWDAFVIEYRPPGNPINIHSISLNSQNRGEISLPWGNTHWFVLVPVVMDTRSTASSLNFTTWANIDTRVPITFKNQIGEENAGGSLLLDNTDNVPSGQSRMLNEGSNHIVQTNEERFPRIDSNYKHHNWKAVNSKFKLVDYFTIPTLLNKLKVKRI